MIQKKKMDIVEEESLENSEALVSVENPTETEEPNENLEEVILVEQLDKLEKIPGYLLGLGIVGIVGTIFTMPYLAAFDIPILLSSIGVSATGILANSKFLPSFVTSKMYKKAKNNLKLKEEEIKRQDLSVDELADLKYQIDVSKEQINSLEKICNERGLNHRFFEK